MGIAKFISETLNFERGGDPKETMRVGRTRRGKFKDQVEEENIVDFTKAFLFLTKNLDQSKWTVGEANTDRYFMISVERKPKKGTYDEFTIIAPKQSDEEGKQLETIGYLYSTSASWKMKTIWKNEDPYINWVEMAQKLLEIINSNPKLPETKFFKKPRFNESVNFERGMDPSDSMKIGIRQKRSFRSVRECAQFFIENIAKLSEGRFKDPDDLKRAFQDNTYAAERTDDPNPQINKSPLRMSKDYLDGFRERDALGNELSHKYPSIFIEEWGVDFDHVSERLRYLRDFHIDLQRILGIHKEEIFPNIKESVNFERGMDPKKSMDIGAIPAIIIFDGSRREIGKSTITLSPEEIIVILKNPAKHINDEIYFHGSAKDKYDNWSGGLFSLEFLMRKGISYNKRDPHILNYASYHNKTYILNPVYESINFERGGDPKGTMQIGWKGRIINWFNESHAFEDFYNGFYNLLPKKISRFTTDHWLIKNIANFVGHSGKNEITPDQFADLLSIILYSTAGDETDKTFKFSKYDDICGYDDQVKDGNLNELISEWLEDGTLADSEKFKKELEEFPNDMYEAIQNEEEEEAEEEKTNKRISV